MVGNYPVFQPFWFDTHLYIEWNKLLTQISGRAASLCVSGSIGPYAAADAPATKKLGQARQLVVLL